MFLNNISFTANYIKPAIIQKINTKNNKAETLEVSCVELNPKDNRDLKAVREVVYDWETTDGYDGAILSYMRNYASEGKYWEVSSCSKEYLDKMKFYAITSQKENFENLDSDDILALGQIKVDDNIELKYLQVKPESFTSYLKKEKFKYIGTQMLKLILSLFPNKDITLCSSPYVYDFYLKNGFEMYKKGGHFIKRQSGVQNNEFLG